MNVSNTPRWAEPRRIWIEADASGADWWVKWLVALNNRFWDLRRRFRLSLGPWPDSPLAHCLKCSSQLTLRKQWWHETKYGLSRFCALQGEQASLSAGPALSFEPTSSRLVIFPFSLENHTTQHLLACLHLHRGSLFRATLPNEVFACWSCKFRGFPENQPTTYYF